MATPPSAAPSPKPASRTPRKGTAAPAVGPGEAVTPPTLTAQQPVQAAPVTAKRGAGPAAVKPTRPKPAPVRARTDGPPATAPSPAPGADAEPAVAPGPDPRPFIIWTLRRTGGTNLAQRLFMSSPFPTVEHEPFNGDRVFGPVSRLWHGPAAVDPASELLERRQQALTVALSKRPLIKHCVELFGDAFNLALVNETVRLGYRHLFLYRRQQADRLLSLHVAKSTGQWGPRQTPTANSPELPPLPATELVSHARHCNRLLTLAWDTLLAAGAPVHMLAFEDVYQESDAARVRERLSFLCGFLLEGCMPVGERARVELLDKLTPRGGRGERVSPHEDLPGMAVLRREMAWQPGFEPTRAARVAGDAEALLPPARAMDGLWLAPWSIGYQPVPLAAQTQVQQALYTLATGQGFENDPAEDGQTLDTFLGARRTDIRNARFRFTVVMHPARRFVATYAQVVLQQRGLSPQRLQALERQHPDLSGVIGALVPDPSLTQFVEHFAAYLKLPELAQLFRPVHEILVSLDHFDRVYAAERLDRLAQDLSNLTGRPVAVFAALDVPKIPASDNNPATLARLRELCAEDTAFLAPVYAAGAAPR